MKRNQASKFVNDLLRLMLSRKGSDLFLTAEFPPAIKVDVDVPKVSPRPFTGQHTVRPHPSSRYSRLMRTFSVATLKYEN